MGARLAAAGRRAMRRAHSSSRVGVTVCAMMALDPAGLSATEAEQEEPWREVWVGARASENYWLAYTGSTIAPFSGLYEDGVRLRFVSGYGGYRYRYSLLRQDRNGASNVGRELSFEGETTFSDGLVGYLVRLGPLTAKAFAGVSMIDHTVTGQNGLTDDANLVQGLEVGPKGVVELWLNMGNNAWASLDLSYTTAHDTGAARVRAGYRLLPTLSTGIEAGFDTNAQSLGAYAADPNASIGEGTSGVFVRYEWNGGEISASGGVSGEVASEAELGTTPYATLNWISHF